MYTYCINLFYIMQGAYDIYTEHGTVFIQYIPLNF